MKYKAHPDAVIVSCFYNPTRSEYRKKAFDIYYNSIKHLNHRIIECVGLKESPQLTVPNVEVYRTDSKAWHKETLLNKAINSLPSKFKYVFWIDADVLFNNPNWLVEAVEVLQTKKVVQPFEYGSHLERDETEPSFDVLEESLNVRYHTVKESPYTKMWRSFAANWATDKAAANSEVYDHHGHVGFAWGARRELLDKIPLFDRALIGGADHLIAHASVGHIPSSCITKSFGKWFAFWWSLQWYARVRGSLGFVEGHLYHIWHGDIKKREYLKRIKDFTPLQKTAKRAEDGFYKPSTQAETYYESYIANRENTAITEPPEEIEFPQSPVTSIIDQWQGFGGGGDFGGAGAGGSWESDSPSFQASTNTENFS